MGFLLRLMATYLPETLLAIAFVALAASPMANLGLFETLRDLHWLQSAKEMAMGSGSWLPTLYGNGFAQAPPLLIALMALFFRIFGSDMAVAQALTAIFGLMALGLTYGLTLALLESRSLALLSATMLALCWGFFHATHLTPFTMASLVATLLTLALFLALIRVGERRKPERRQMLWLSRALGAHLGIATLMTGLPGVTLGATILLAFLAWQRRLRALSGVQWREVLVFLGVVLLPWAFFAFKEGLSPAFGWITPLPSASSLGQFVMNTLSGAFWAMAPWTFLAAAGLVEAARPYVFSGGRFTTPEPWKFLWCWLLLSLLALPFSPLAFLPPVCLIAAQFTARRFEDTLTRRSQSWAVDATVLALMLLAVFWTVAAFQRLPDAYPGLYWPFPGDPMIATPEFLSKFSLPPAFPAWKLWLLGGPPLLLLTAGAYYVWTWLEKPVNGLISLMAGTLIFYAMVNLIIAPMFAAPAGVRAADAVRRFTEASRALHSSHTASNAALNLVPTLAWQALPATDEDPLALARARLLFSLDPLTSRAVRFASGSRGLAHALQTLPADTGLLALMAQPDYYHLPFNLRERFRTLAADGAPRCAPIAVIRPDQALNCDRVGETRLYLLALSYEGEPLASAEEASPDVDSATSQAESP
ncbi:MAG: glycosyltransferase family 39 protein [Vampirovibrionales bacterium]|nr:glycosyltransferase family 39 protein [Vampirovibrionales bacterium]